MQTWRQAGPDQPIERGDTWARAPAPMIARDPRWRPRWWHVALLLVLLLALVPLVLARIVREQGLARWHAFLETARQQEPAEWDREAAIAALGPADPALQRELERLVARAQMQGEIPHLDPEYLELGVIYDHRPLPEDFEREVEALLPVLMEARALLAEPDLMLAGEAEILRDPDGFRQAGLDVFGFGLPDINLWRHHARMAGIQVLRGDDPTPWLQDLERLGQRHHPVSLLGSLVHISIQALRDRAALYGVLVGSLDEPAREAWLAEPPPQIATVQAGLRGERLLLALAAFPELVEGELDWGEVRENHLGKGSPEDFEAWTEFLEQATRAWLFAADDLRLILQTYRQAERHLVDPTQPWPLPPEFRSDLGRSMSGMQGMMSEMLAQNLWRHRSHRLAAWLVHRHRSGSPLPEDHAAFLAQAPLPAVIHGMGIRYEALGPHRFRLGSDPATPGPGFAPGIHAVRRIPIGAAAADRPLRIGSWTIEVLVPIAGTLSQRPAADPAGP